MALELVETLKGDGIGIWHSVRVSVSYLLRVYEDRQEIGTKGRYILGVREIRGRVVPVFGSPGEILTLELQNGEKIQFRFNDAEGAMEATG